MGSQQKKKERTEDIRSVTTEIKRTQDLDVNKLALEPTFELGYSPVGIGTTSHVNVSTSINSSQTNAPAPPAQVIGLNVTVIGNNQLNLTWTASTDPNLVNYNIYRSTVSGAEGFLTTSVTNSYSDITVSAGTTYYYKVTAVSNAGEGALSVEDSATTTGSPPAGITPSLELHFNNSYADTSPNAFTLSGIFSNGFTTIAGAFGSAGWRCNSPSYVSGSEDFFLIGTNTAPLQMDTAIGFSISLWVYPTNLGAITKRRVIMEKGDDTSNNKWTLQVDSAGILYFFVRKAGVDYKAQVGGFTTGSWQHIGATFAGTTNTAIVYRNAVAGGASAVTPQYDTNTSELKMHIGIHTEAPASDSRYEGYYDEIRYYKSVVLTPTQITNLKNTNAP